MPIEKIALGIIIVIVIIALGLSILKDVFRLIFGFIGTAVAIVAGIISGKREKRIESGDQ